MINNLLIPTRSTYKIAHDLSKNLDFSRNSINQETTMNSHKVGPSTRDIDSRSTNSSINQGSIEFNNFRNLSHQAGSFRDPAMRIAENDISNFYLQKDNLPPLIHYNQQGKILPSGAASLYGRYYSSDGDPKQEFEDRKTMKFFGILLIASQLFMLFLYAGFVRYDSEQANPIYNSSSNSYDRSPQILHEYYNMFQDVNVMIFIGFGFLMTFLRKYGYSAVGYNLLIAVVAIQWSVLCRGLFYHEGGTISLNIISLINGDFAAAAVLITYGAVLGVANPVQLLVICLIEVFVYALNEYIGAELFQAIDVGGSMYIHTFGAYFGLALSWVLRKNEDVDTKNEGSSYTSDLFAMIGTVFLFMFWPSFNAAMTDGDDQHRTVINTVLSLTASCMVTFAMSALLSHENKLDMVHIQNASLAGGVAVGAVADLMIKPFGALVIGSLAGLLSVVGYRFITPFLQRTIGLHDTCGVHNLHGMPGLLAGLAGAVMASLASEESYGHSLYQQYPARAPEENSSLLDEIRKDFVDVQPGLHRDGTSQALYQLSALGVTLGIAICGGLITGLVMRLPVFEKVPNEYLFDDTKFWETPSDEEKCTTVDVSSNANMGFEMETEKPEKI